MMMVSPVRAEDPAGTMTVATTGEAPAADVSLDRLAVGNAIDNKELAGEGKEFEAGIGKVYAWARLNAAQPPVDVRFVWYAEGSQVADVTIPVKYATARIWSSKNIWPGAWKVAVMAGERTLGETEFSVK
jgi:hypothetical protein